jgi:uncharacterized protein
MPTYYIDGYNVIHHSSRLRPLLDVSIETARDALIEHVSRLLVGKGHQAVLVFDGRGKDVKRLEAETVAPGLEVIYSPERLSADSVIERKIYSAANRGALIVVTSDRGIRDLCRGMGAMTMTPDHFLTMAQQTAQEMHQELEHKQEGKRLANVEDGLDSSTVERLRALKKKLEP